MPWELVSLIIDDYDRAISFFTDVLDFESHGQVVVFRDPWGNLWDLLG